MRYFLFLCLIFSLCSPSVEAGTSFKGFLLNENSIVVYSIEDLFDGVCLSEFGKQKIKDIKDKFDNKTIFIECYTNDVGDYKSSWELSLIYSYNLTLYLIKNCEIKAENITYIGYGFSSRYKNLSNVIVFNVYDK